MIAKVIFKDEGDWGYIITRTQKELDAGLDTDELGVLYDPEHEQKYGSLEDAEALAAEHNAELEVT